LKLVANTAVTVAAENYKKEHIIITSLQWTGMRIAKLQANLKLHFPDCHLYMKFPGVW